jgi:hypothetical protein
MLQRGTSPDPWKQQPQGGNAVSVTLNGRAYTFARHLIEDGRFVLDERDAWSEHRPSTEQENDFIARGGFADFGLWYLGIDDRYGDETKSHYKFPYGDFERLHLCGVIAVESRAGQRKYTDIELTAAHLHGRLEELMKGPEAGSARPQSGAAST